MPRGEVVQEKPLGITERRLLDKLVSSEFEGLQKELAIYANELTTARRAEIEAQYANRAAELDEVRARWREMRSRWNEELAVFQTELREQGIQMGREGYNERFLQTSGASFELKDKAQALAEVDNEVKLQLNRARVAVDRKRLELQRKVLLSGVNSTAAQALLAEIPDPRALIIEALQGARPALAAVAAPDEERTA